ncbi:MAG: PLP-dependent aspartate aminotransferase family protein [Deltaproteobacteria bacterium]|nr:PLP-dependent aspartate aminotransferase family protein [Deltaproteobacteria bacterium]
MSDPHRLAPSTLAAHAGGGIDPITGAIVPAFQPSTTYARNPDYALIGPADYTRDGNPTYPPAERLLAQLEGGAEAMLYASGMAAATAVFRALCRRGDHVVAPLAQYWGLRNWLRRFGAEHGIEVELVECAAPAGTDALVKAIRPGKTRLVWLETPANPTWDVVDIAAAAHAAHAAGAILAVDSTAATPVFSRPIELGADLVMHSATKYLNGHSDVLAGALVTAKLDDAWAALHVQRRSEGAVLGAFEAWLLLRGMRTLYARVERQAATAADLAARLEQRRDVRVLYPGLASHPGHAVAARQMHGGFGAMMSVRLNAGRAAALAVCARLGVFARATSLGGVESLVEHRHSVEGADTPTPDDLLRLSIGLEHPDDLWRDLAGALDAVGR